MDIDKKVEILCKKEDIEKDIENIIGNDNNHMTKYFSNIYVLLTGEDSMSVAFDLQIYLLRNKIKHKGKKRRFSRHYRFKIKL